MPCLTFIIIDITRSTFISIPLERIVGLIYRSLYNLGMQNLIHTLLLFFILSSLGCSFKNKKNPETLTVGLSAIPATMDPRFALDAEGMKIGSLIFQSLVTIGPDMNVVGDAAESWKMEQKGPEFILSFPLKSHLKFSDATPVTCDDVLFSIQEYKSDSSPFKSAYDNIKHARCEQHILTLHLDSYSEKMLNSDLPVLKILPRKVFLTEATNSSVINFDDFSYKNLPSYKTASDRFKEHLVGSGPFAVLSQGETTITLRPNTHFTKPPQLKKVEFKVIKDDFTRFLQMYRGDLDLAVSTMPKNKVASLERMDFLDVIRRPGLKMAYILVNFKNSTLSSLKNRQLLFQSFNVEEVIKYKLEGLGEPASSILTKANPYFNHELLSLLPERPSEPEELRKQILESDAGKAVLLLKTSNTREAVENAKLLTNQMRQYGFRVRHESYEWGTYFKDIKEGNYDLATMTWVGAYDPDIYRIALSRKELPPQGRNRGYYQNPDFDRLVEAGAQETNTDKRREIYKKAQEIAIKDLAILPLWYEDSITVIHKRVKNYTPSLNGDYSNLVEATLTP